MISNLRLILGGKTRKKTQGPGAEALVAAPTGVAAIEAEANGSSAELTEALDLFNRDISRIVKNLDGDILRARDHSVQAGEHLGSVKRSIDTLADASDKIDAEIAGVARSTDELQTAADEITNTVKGVQDKAAVTLASADSSATQIENLGQAVQQIGALLNSISEIATRTNLLALNATIEAARAGEAGRGFAVVAGEVKALSVAAAQSVSAIRARMEELQGASQNAISNMHAIREEIVGLTPICDLIANSAQTQRQAIGDLADRMLNAQAATREVTAAVRSVEDLTVSAVTVSRTAAELSVNASREAEDLERRVVTILRTIPAADRRRHERYPIDLPVRIKAGGEILACRTFDIGVGGILIKPLEKGRLESGVAYEAELSRVGAVRLRVVGQSPLGVHCAFIDISDNARAELDATLDAFRKENQPLIDRAQLFAGQVTRAIDAELAAGRLSLENLLDTDYQPIPNTDPVQLRTQYLDRFEQILPPVFEAMLVTDPNMVFCLAVDRNAYIPVHMRKFSQPQRPGERVWNHANARNRRIFDDRAGLLAARLMRPFLIQSYNRDMGGGVFVPMKEIDAPLVIAGHHWGGVRMAYKI